MQKPKFFILDCSGAANCCDKKEYNEASLREKTSMIIHNLFCKRCREYSTKNSKLTELIKKARIKGCTSEEKRNIKERLKKEISKQGSVK